MTSLILPLSLAARKLPILSVWFLRVGTWPYGLFQIRLRGGVVGCRCIRHRPLIPPTVSKDKGGRGRGGRGRVNIVGVREGVDGCRCIRHQRLILPTVSRDKGVRGRGGCEQG